MKFELNEYRRNIPEEDLLQDMRRVATLLGQSHLSGTDYKEHGKYSYGGIRKRFNGWTNACKKAGLSYANVVASVWRHGNQSLPDEAIISDLQHVANLLEKNTITTGDYAIHGSYDKSTILRKFKTWNNALSLANLQKSSNVNTSNEELLTEIERLWTKLGRQPTSTDIKNGISIYSLNTYSRRFGGWRGSLESFVQYINEEDDKASIDEPQSLESCQISTLAQEIKLTSGCESQNYELRQLPQTIDADVYGRKANRDPNLRLRFRVLRRDNFKCCACGASPAKDPSVELHIDHVIPWAKGGETIIENLQTLCSSCNYGKSDL